MDLEAMGSEDLRKVLRDLQELVKSPGWAQVLDLCAEQLYNRGEMIFKVPLMSMDEVLGQEYSKGEMAGIALFKEMPELTITAIETLIKEKGYEG